MNVLTDAYQGSMPSAGGTMPRQEMLGWIRKLAKHEPVREPASSIPPQSLL